MKAGWEKKSIGDVCEIINGGTPKSGVKEYWNGNFQWITPAEMGKRQSPYVAETERKITDTGLRDSSAKLLPPKSVILSSRAPIGHLVINTIPMATNQGCKGLIPEKSLYYKFLYYYLYQNVDLLNSLGTGATFKELSGGKLKEVPIYIAPLPEQQRIVSILDEAFEGIATAVENVEKNLINAREIFESHLEAVFANRGEGWVEKPISQCFKVRSGDFLPAREMANYGDFDVYGGNGFIGKHNKGNLSGENVIIGRVGAKCGNVRQVSGDIWVTDNAFYISQFFCEFDLEFLAHSLGRKNLRSTANQAAQPVISYTTIKDVVLEFPVSKSIQKIISDGFRDISVETQRLESIYQQKLTALDELKKSILHKAFSGQLN